MTVTELIAEYVRGVIAAESEALECQCESALVLTPPEYWHRLTVVEVMDINRARVPRCVACLLDGV